MTVSQPHLSALNALLDQAIAHLRSFSQQDIQATWRWREADLSHDQALDASLWEQWAIAPLNQRHHVAWHRGQRVLWLAQRLHLPAHLNGFPLSGMTLRLALTWWADDAQIYVNGVLMAEGDLFDCFGRLLLAPHVMPGTWIDVAIRLVSPGHDDGALVRSRCLYEMPNQAVEPVPEPGFVADEMAVIQTYLNALAPEQLGTVVSAVDAAGLIVDPGDVGSCDVDCRDAAELNGRLQQLRQRLQPLSPWIKQRQFHLLGHAHLDLAWLWPIAETWDVAQRTFESVLALQAEFPEMVFTHSTPALYDWIETHRPDLFSAIHDQVQRGTWEVGAGLWVEPEFNIVSGESIVRQVLYGQRYTQERFGQISRIAWLPDSFGFCWQLPQILTQGGIDYFATQKLRWNDTTRFPHELFRWRSPDGTAITSVTLPPIGSDVNPVAMATYASQWEVQTGQPDALWLPGMGDHGGGPSRDMLTVARRWARSPFFPQVTFSTAQSFLDECCAATAPETLPQWNDELYLELHRGCYTTHAEQKRWNRRCEVLLYQAELFAAIATLTTGAAFPQSIIEQAWKQVLFNQFHDILPGSSIPEVYEEANPLWQQAETAAEQVLQQALGAIAQSIDWPAAPQPEGVPLVLFNSLTWERSEVVTVPLPEGDRHWSVVDLEHQPLPSQSTGDGRLRFQTPAVPGVGYGLVWLCPNAEPEATSPALSEAGLDPAAAANEADPEAWILENARLRVSVDPTTGDVASLFDKTQQRQVLWGAANQLQTFRDQGQYWDAWNIAPDYADHPLPPAKLLSMTWIERGEVQQRLRVVRQVGRSPVQQDYVLDIDAPLLQIETDIDWQEDFTLLKAAFPVCFTGTAATTETACGAIARPLQPQTPTEQAKWEVPALNWADLSGEYSDSNADAESAPSETPKANPASQANHVNANSSDPKSAYGISLLSDYKHGYDFTPDQLRLTLLKSPKWPDPNADRGRHRFTYALYPHAGTWVEAQITRQGYRFNQPLLPLTVDAAARHLGGKTLAQDASSSKAIAQSSSPLPPAGQFIDLKQPNLVLMAFKPEDPTADLVSERGLERGLERGSESGSEQGQERTSHSESNQSAAGLPSRRWILRCYEAHGQATAIAPNQVISEQLSLRWHGTTNLLEHSMLQNSGDRLSPSPSSPSRQATGNAKGSDLAIAPWKIVTLEFER